jgi:putative FmdB family regulatory protein
MPTYEYRCQSCGYDLEAFQRFSDPPLAVCPKCGGELRKVFNSVGVVFKGSGFYATDSRAKSGKVSGDAPSAAGESGAKDPGAKPAGAAKPADAAKPAAPKPSPAD